MHPVRNARVALLVPALLALLTARETPAQAPAAGEWKVFQEFNFLIGSWSGTAESAGRIGGRVDSFGLEVDGSTLSYRATTFYPVKNNLPEARSEEVAHIVYDGSKGKYVALLILSTKAWGLFDAEVRPDGSIHFTSREMANLEAGTRSRWTLSRKADGALSEQLEVAAPGKEFATFLGATLTKK